MACSKYLVRNLSLRAVKRKVAQTSICDASFATLKRMTHPPNFYKRNLPHWHPPGQSIFLTWRLHGSLPQSVINSLKVTRQYLKNRQEAGSAPVKRILQFKKMFARVDAILDKAESGPLWLKGEAIADLVQAALLERYAKLYILWAYVVMANHLHVLLKPKSPDTTVASI